MPANNRFDPYLLGYLWFQGVATLAHTIEAFYKTTTLFSYLAVSSTMAWTVAPTGARAGKGWYAVNRRRTAWIATVCYN
jgi:hypothetical protein